MTDRRIELEVGGMTCENCETHVARALAGVGAREVRAGWRRAQATFVAPSDLDPERVRAGVAEIGYTAGTLRYLDAADRPPRSGPGGSNSYDLAIIGSGSAAFAAAIKATELGGRVVMVERGTLGGTCVNVGCVPSKALLRAAEGRFGAGHHPFAGVETSVGPIDLAALVAQKDELVASMRQQKYADLVTDYGWDVIAGEARFEDAYTLSVGGTTLHAGAYLIATGASPAVPPIPGLVKADYLTSTTALELTELPRRLAVIGGNAIGLELGQLFARLGSRVTLFEVLPRIAPFEEPEISLALAERLAGEGVEIVTGAQIEGVDGGKVRAIAGGVERTWDVDRILLAAGRRANTAALGLERAGIDVDRGGAIVVDDRLRTANPRVWAAGDVTASPQFVYVAAYQGTLAAENILAGSDRRVDLAALPRVTFTQPQVASVGLTEAQARDAGFDVRTSLLPLSHVPRAIVNRDTDGLFKLVADVRTDRLLGAHILADNAGDVIDSATLALKFGLTVDDLATHFAPYLTMAEGLKLAAQTFGKDVSRLSCCAA